MVRHGFRHAFLTQADLGLGLVLGHVRPPLAHDLGVLVMVRVILVNLLLGVVAQVGFGYVEVLVVLQLQLWGAEGVLKVAPFEGGLNFNGVGSFLELGWGYKRSFRLVTLVWNLVVRSVIYILSVNQRRRRMLLYFINVSLEIRISLIRYTLITSLFLFYL